FFFFFSSRRRHTRSKRDWSSDVCSSDLIKRAKLLQVMTKLLTLLTLMSVVIASLISSFIDIDSPVLMKGKLLFSVYILKCPKTNRFRACVYEKVTYSNKSMISFIFSHPDFNCRLWNLTRSTTNTI